MNLLQMKYILYVEKYHSFSRAAKKLYVSQPGISKGIKDVEDEYGIQLFNRESGKVSLTEQGIKLIRQISPIVEQAEYIDDYYRHNKISECTLSVACQHHAVALNTMEECLLEVLPDKEKYEIRFLEVMTKEVIEYVHSGVCEIGLLLKNKDNRVIKAELDSRNLEFKTICENKSYVYLGKQHPLAEKSIITDEDLEPYPFMRYYQGKGSMKYFSEEVVESHAVDKVIYVTDDMTIGKLAQKLNAYMIGSGHRSEEKMSDEIITIPYDSNEFIELGWIYEKNKALGTLAKKYIAKFENKLIK